MIGLATVYRHAPSFILLACVAITPALADEWALCDYHPPAPDIPHPDDGRLRFEADQAFLDREGVSRLEGNVEVFEGTRTFTADRFEYEQARNYLEAMGNVTFEDKAGLSFDSSAGHLYLESERGRFEDVEYFFRPRHARGKASTIEPRGPDRFRLSNASYTTCDPGRQDWQLTASRVDLNQDTGRGTARNVLLRFHHVPLLYTPWINFPIDDRRQTGLLLPSIGNADSTGLDVEIPYYFNLAPNRDAILAPRYLGRRGTMLGAQYRHMSGSSLGRFDMEYLPDDDVYGDDRSWFTWDQEWRPTSRLSLHTRGTDVSDADYLSDFGSSLDDTSTTHLERRADLSYQASNWNLLARVEDYQTVDDNIVGPDRPYKRLPQLLYRGHWPQATQGLDLGMRAEWVSFDRRDSVTGQRTDIMPEASLPLQGAAWFLTPRVRYRLTHYDLEGQPSGADSQLQRDLPIASVDGGLFFDRPMGGERFQTLEPRIFYRYTPYRNQDDIPRFDTSEYGFSFDQLFRDESFSGPDRVANANQLTTALTSRVVEADSGIERFRVSLGQIQYFDDRRVRLRPEDAARTQDSSSIVAEAAWRPDRYWNVRGTTQWDPHREQTERRTAQLQYREDGNRVVNLGYRFQEDRLEQTDLSFAWPLSKRWDAVGRWAYSLEDHRDLEILAGLEYNTCCWGARVVARRYLTDGVQGEYNEGIYFQLILKGLGSLGTGLGELLSEGILGYEDDY
ncbi:LPS-assembly protein LptD [Ectothiorhodospira sp. BSL-9]|uniref:LPS-assembly protein LptD n=1 Tax=Ectothiorhodospira sp. BSL-9 TaxID=1442136 RepID=UPI0007B42D39|nr:LPS assembly protein LptD [Ectothiorhodospira sp. BSL-9]ANB02334.1 organic solvent tolerance protein [Ectothiorhodospira sp. BSL-9]TVQ74184.1 MAG: LPS-assembly protein LptD [Chromatiaceae bacterium]